MTRSGPRLAPRVIILYLGPFGPPPSTSKSPQFSMTSGISSTYALPRQMQAEESRPHTPTCLRKNDRPDGHNCRPTRQLRGRPGRWPQLSADPAVARPARQMATIVGRPTRQLRGRPGPKNRSGMRDPRDTSYKRPVTSYATDHIYVYM